MDGEAIKAAVADDPMESMSGRFLGQWSRLISTTNWEKGRIIATWREAMITAQVAPRFYSDEAWSQRVGNVTSQHVGRLRRVYERFFFKHKDYAGLYWSHFQAALDWEDAEQWLQGAVDSGWSVAKMRHRRWEALGDPLVPEPREDEVVLAEVNEDYDPTLDAPFDADDRQSSTNRAIDEGGSEFDDDIGEFDDGSSGEDSSLVVGEDQVAPVRPFETLPELPNDVTDAFDAFKLVILHHKMAGWKDITPAVLLSALDSLKQLVTAASGDGK